jgi:hypothetical protein
VLTAWMQDDEAELLRELERIKKEREQDAAKKVVVLPHPL